jgi:heptaprenyl diphosphate synthase
MKLLQLYGKWHDDLQFIERKLAESVRTDHKELNAASLHLLQAGGKRLRPIFVLLSGRFGTFELEHLAHVAVSLELIHMATLVHDDVIDDALTRRGELTVKAKWDERTAMYTGDFIFGKALTIVTKLEQPQIHRILSRAVVKMVIGEMEQLRYFNNLEQKTRDYLLRIRRKTAILIAISCKLGALAAGASQQAANQLYSYGYNAGMAFQIRDDILDINGTQKQLGKPPGSDLRQGNITLPILFAIRDEQVRIAVSSVIENQPNVDEKALQQVLALVRKSGGIEEANKLSLRYIDKAIQSLEPLPDIPAKQDLTQIASFIADRSY